MTRKDKIQLVVIWGFVAVMFSAIYIAYAIYTNTPANAAVADFDHSTCQYPDRWSNPKDGCDNSDPAVPECIKAWQTKESEQACIDAFVAANQQPVETVPTPTPVVEPQPVANCSGK